jgi:hypothetical protein
VVHIDDVSGAPCANVLGRKRMRYAFGAAWILACLMLAIGLTRVGLPAIGSAMAAETQTASVDERAAAPDARGSRHNMSTLPKTAQMRCPAGQLVFLSAACGCNGACCACSLAQRYLNHCTCQCQQAPPPAGACRFGFSVGSQ